MKSIGQNWAWRPPKETESAIRRGAKQYEAFRKTLSAEWRKMKRRNQTALRCSISESRRTLRPA